MLLVDVVVVVYMTERLERDNQHYCTRPKCKKELINVQDKKATTTTTPTLHTKPQDKIRFEKHKNS